MRDCASRCRVQGSRACSARRTLAGQRVTYIERGRDGTSQTITTTRRRLGHIEFTPLATPGPHTIDAIVEQYGIPRTRETLVQYTVSTHAH